MIDLVCCYSKMKREKSVVDTGDTSNAFNDLSEAPLSGVVGHDVGSSRSREPEINCRKHGCSLTIEHTQSTGLCTALKTAYHLPRVAAFVSEQCPR